MRIEFKDPCKKESFSLSVSPFVSFCEFAAATNAETRAHAIERQVLVGDVVAFGEIARGSSVVGFSVLSTCRQLAEKARRPFVRRRAACHRLLPQR